MPLTTRTLLSKLDPRLRAELTEVDERATAVGASAEQRALAHALLLALNSPRAGAPSENPDVTTNE